MTEASFETRALEVYGRLWELMESSQFESFDQILTPDCKFYADDQTHVGLEDIVVYFKGVMARLPDLRHEITSTITGTNALAAEIVARGTMQAPPGGMPVQVEIKACDFLWYEGERIFRWHAYTDTAGLSRQLAGG
jgi:predicted ester cyclase